MLIKKLKSAKHAGAGQGCLVTSAPKKTFTDFELVNGVSLPSIDAAANGDYEKVIASSTSTFTILERCIGMVIDFTAGVDVGTGKYKVVATIKDARDRAVVLTYKIKALNVNKFQCILPFVGTDGKLLQVFHAEATKAASTQSVVVVVTGADGTGYTAEALNAKNEEVSEYHNSK